jgi:hypothetical protein
MAHPAVTDLCHQFKMSDLFQFRHCT